MISGGHYPGPSLPEAALPGLKMAGVWDALVDQDWGLLWHRNEGVELTFLEQGRLDFSTDEGPFDLESNSLTIVRPWQRHRLGNPNIRRSRLHWLLIDVGVRRPDQTWNWPPWLVLSSQDIAELTVMLRQNERTVWKANQELKRSFQAIAQCLGTDSNGGHISRLTLHLNELLLVLLETMRHHKDVRLDEKLTTSNRTVELFLADLKIHPEHLSLPWTVEKMAHSCGLKATQFIHHVKLLVNMTPARYLIECRIEFAKALLRSQPKPGITETAMQCGFASSQYFATVFSRQLGLSPREYVRKYGICR
jgi:AraC-like DNA-binding protein